MVIASNIREPRLDALAKRLWAKEIPLLLVRSYGLMGCLRIFTPEHAGTPINETARHISC